MKIIIICRDENYRMYHDMLVKGGFIISDHADLLFKEIGHQQTTLTGKSHDGSYKLIHYDDIYLVESFAHQVIVHTSNEEYRVKERLFEIEGIFENQNVIRINKSQIITKENIAKIVPQFNSRLKIILKNKIVVYVTRMYLQNFRKMIGM